MKNTYGTGCFMLMLTGERLVHSANGLLTTIAWSEQQSGIRLEGSIIAGAAVQWLRDSMKLIFDSKDSEYFATQVEDSLGVYVVPAFVGLGAPYWDMYARGAIMGLTRGATRNHIIRATLESIAYQTRDILNHARRFRHRTKRTARGRGASANDFLMQFQSDIWARRGKTGNHRDNCSGRRLSGGTGRRLLEDQSMVAERCKINRKFQPGMSKEKEKNWR